MKCLAISFVLIVLALTSAAQAPDATPDYVPDAKTAIAIGEAVLIPVYGESKIRGEEPFTAELERGMWTVAGTLYCRDNHGNRTTNNCEGGTAVVEVWKKDGRILSMTHYK